MIQMELLKSFLRYEPETGDWFWLVQRGRVPVGYRAGCSKRHDGYTYIRICGKFYVAHRLAWFYMTGAWPQKHIDHINGKRTDNRWCNLREATRAQNQANYKKPRTNTSGFKGVSWHMEGHKWVAQISANRRRYHLGLFSSKEEAYQAYVKAAKALHGEFANVN